MEHTISDFIKRLMLYPDLNNFNHLLLDPAHCAIRQNNLDPIFSHLVNLHLCSLMKGENLCPPLGTGRTHDIDLINKDNGFHGFPGFPYLTQKCQSKKEKKNAKKDTMRMVKYRTAAFRFIVHTIRKTAVMI